MTTDQALVLAVLAAALGLFLWGRLRHDIVALAALLAAVFLGLVPAEAAFLGFGHPAVITVACVLVLSRALQDSGAIDHLARRILPSGHHSVTVIAALTGFAAVLSAFMNNVGALALLMPLAIQAAGRAGLQPGQVLMPLAFGSILGGMITLIGTPPNLIVASFRAETDAGAFGMFDFAPVGAAVALTGIAFIAAIGWRLVPARPRAAGAGFDAGTYVTEARVRPDTRADGLTLAAAERALAPAEARIVGLIRDEEKLARPRRNMRVRAGDILQIEAEPDGIAQTLANLGLRLEEAVPPTRDQEAAHKGSARRAEAAAGPDGRGAEDGAEPPALSEMAVMPGSVIVGHTARGLDLRTRYHINLLAVTRGGRRSPDRLRDARLQAGDVLLLQGTPEALAAFSADQGCLPLAERPLRLPDPRRMLLAIGIMGMAVTVAAIGLLPAAVAFATGLVAVMVTRLVPPRSVYRTIDWPVIVLLGALLPVADALAATGAAALIAETLVRDLARGEPVLALVVVLVVTMALSDVMNNAATAAVMAPIALGLAARLEVSADPLLMAVAVGASCAFLTPIGHQNNTLILGPGGFRFGDYWRLGLPVQLIVLAVAVPLIPWVWPF